MGSEDRKATLAELAQQNAYKAHELHLEAEQASGRRERSRLHGRAQLAADVAQALALAADPGGALDLEAYRDGVGQGLSRGRARAYLELADELEDTIADADGDVHAEERLGALVDELRIRAEDLADELVDAGHLAEGSRP